MMPATADFTIDNPGPDAPLQRSEKGMPSACRGHGAAGITGRSTFPCGSTNRFSSSAADYGYDGLIPNIYLQDEIAKIYAEIAAINGIRYYDFDGFEFLWNSSHGYYSTKRFLRKMFEHAKELGVDKIISAETGSMTFLQ